MSYTGTQAQSGSQVVFAINTGTVSTPVYTAIGEVLSFTQTAKSNKTADCTNLESAAEEFIATLLSPGTYTLKANRVPEDDGQTAVTSAFNAKAMTLFKVTLPKAPSQTSTGDTYVFTAIVEEQNDLADVTPTKQITTEFKLKVSGSITFTEGS